MPARSTAGATRAAPPGSSGSGALEHSGCARLAGGSSASEILRDVAFFAPQARPERGVDHRLDRLGVGHRRGLLAALDRLGVLSRKVIVQLRRDHFRGRICLDLHAPPHFGQKHRRQPLNISEDRDMARGWESKSVEDQMAQLESDRRDRRKQR